MPFKTPSKSSEYIRTVLAPEKDERMRALTKYADENMIPVLLPESAALLEQLVSLKKPKKILEIGTAIGYSAALILRNCLGKLTTIEINEDYAALAKKNLSIMGYDGRFNVFIGDADDILPFMDGKFDFVFMDGPKTRYPGFLPHVKRMLAPGGVLLADNVFFNGMVTGEGEIKRCKQTIINGLDKFLHDLTSDERYFTSVLPVGDGMSLTVKKQ